MILLVPTKWLVLETYGIHSFNRDENSTNYKETTLFEQKRKNAVFFILFYLNKCFNDESFAMVLLA
jgi:hypothetical protein